MHVQPLHTQQERATSGSVSTCLMLEHPAAAFRHASSSPSLPRTLSKQYTMHTGHTCGGRSARPGHSHTAPGQTASGRRLLVQRCIAAQHLLRPTQQGRGTGWLADDSSGSPLAAVQYHSCTRAARLPPLQRAPKAVARSSRARRGAYQRAPAGAACPAPACVSRWP